MIIWLVCLVVAGVAILLWFLGGQMNNKTVRDAGFIVGVLNTPLLAFLLRGTLAVALAFGIFGFLSAPTPAFVSDHAPSFVLDLTPKQAAAYNGSAYSNASSACQANAYCTVQWQTWGGSDQWDHVQVILYMWCYGNYSYSTQYVGVTNGTWQVFIWLASGCYSSYAEVRYWDWAGNVYHFPRW